MLHSSSILEGSAPRPPPGVATPGPRRRWPSAALVGLGQSSSARWVAQPRTPYARPPLLRGTGDGIRVGNKARCSGENPGGQGRRPWWLLAHVIRERIMHAHMLTRPERLSKPFEPFWAVRTPAWMALRAQNRSEAVVRPYLPLSTSLRRAAHPSAVARPSQEGWTGERPTGQGSPPGACCFDRVLSGTEARACGVQGSQTLAGVWGRSPPVMGSCRKDDLNLGS